MNRRRFLIAPLALLPLPAVAAWPAKQQRVIEFAHMVAMPNGPAFALGRWKVGAPFATLPGTAEKIPVPGWVIDIARRAR